MSTDLEEAVAKFTAELPDWWWTVGKCNLTCHASCGPDVSGVDGDLARTQRIFDEGFHADLAQPSTPAQALLDVLDQAKACRTAYQQGTKAFDAFLTGGMLKSWGVMTVASPDSIR